MIQVKDAQFKTPPLSIVGVGTSVERVSDGPTVKLWYDNDCYKGILVCVTGQPDRVVPYHQVAMWTPLLGPNVAIMKGGPVTPAVATVQPKKK